MDTNKKKGILGGDVLIERVQNEIFSGRGDVLLFVRIRGTSSLNVSRAERMTVENVCTLIHHRLRSDRTREMLLKHGVKLMSMETPCVSSLDSHARTIPEVKKKGAEEKSDERHVRANDFVCFRNVYFSVSKPEDPSTNPKFWVGRINSIKKDNSQRICDLQWYVETAQGSGLYRRATKTFRQLSNQLYFIEDMERDDVADNIWRRRRVYKPSAGALSDSSSTTIKNSADNIMIATPSESSRDAELLRIWREKAEKCDEFKQRAQKAEKELESLRKRLKNFGGENIPRIDDTVYKKNSTASDLESHIAKVEKDNQKQFEKMERNIDSEIKSLTSSPSTSSSSSSSKKVSYRKYIKMVTMHLPVGAAIGKARSDGISESEIPKLKFVLEGLKKFGKYIKMVQMHMPIGAAFAKATQDGIPDSDMSMARPIIENCR